tara:strand:+ start:33 stop:461 length:429 start_codon:yes stop_codon:yes gene_type:complete
MSKKYLKKAFQFCLKNGHRLTEPRKKVLEIIASSTKPIKAYEILKKLSIPLNFPKPPTAYRAIEFWQTHNFIHRIESLNSYFICKANHKHKGAQFMVCNKCGVVIESHICEIPSEIVESLKKKSFAPLSWNLEVSGTCRQCS